MSQILRYKTGSIVPNVLMTDTRGNIKPIVAMEAESMAIFREAVAEGIGVGVGVGVIGEQDLVPDPRI